MATNKFDEKNLEKLKDGREYRNTAEITATSTEEGRKIVEGYATTFGEKYELYSGDGYTFSEVIDANAFNECDMSDTIMQYDHAGRVFARKSNNTLELTVDSKGLRIKADLGGTSLGGELYEEIKNGYTNKMSMGFKVKEDKREVIRDTETGAVEVIRTILKFKKLYDVSAVSIPANDMTEISARTLFDGAIEELEAERLSAEMRINKINQIKILTQI